MNKFKIGDRVKVLPADNNIPNYSDHVGCKYEVVDVSYHGDVKLSHSIFYHDPSWLSLVVKPTDMFISRWKAQSLHLATTTNMSWRAIARKLGVAETTNREYLTKVLGSKKERNKREVGVRVDKVVADLAERLRGKMSATPPSELLEKPQGCRDMATVAHVRGREKPLAEDNSRILVISDLHIPYHHPDAISFLQHLKAKYNPTRVISMGDECFPPDVEVLTDDGFIRFDQLRPHNLIAQWDEGFIDFVQPERYVEKLYKGKLLEYKHRSLVSRTTPKHNLIKVHPTKGTVHKREAWDSYGNESWHIPRCGVFKTHEGVNLSDAEVKLLVAFQADGTFTKGAARFMFTKERKSERLLQLLSETGIKYSTHNIKDGFQYYIEVDSVPAYFTKQFSDISFLDFSEHQREIFLREIQYWDGTATQNGKGVRYTSAVKSNVEYVQNLATISGYVPSKVNPANGESSCWMVDLVWDRENCSLKSAKVSEIDYEGFVYCVTVPSGAIIVKTDGHVHVSGNCDKHALSYHDSDPDLGSAGDELTRSLPFIQELKELFPVMDILDSNHGSMVWRKAKTHGIPRHYIKSYNDVLGVDSGWRWMFDLTIELPNGNKCYFHHGKSSDVVNLSQTMGMCAVQGHYHEKFKIDYWSNPVGLYWGLQTGCLISDNSLAFSYNNVNIKRPTIGTAVIIDSQPILEPLIMGQDGRWVGINK